VSLYGSRDAKRLATARRAQFALKTALERIDYMEGVRKELEALERGDIVVKSKGSHQADAANTLKELAPAVEPNADGTA
jgi:hypothetical protein